MNGIAEVQARMAQIQARMDTLSPRPAQPTPTAGTAGSSFADALSTAQSEAADATSSATAVSTVGRSGGPDATTLIAAAKKYLGVPYKWGGTDPKTGGLDCSGFVQRAFKDVGITLPRVTQTQVKEGRAVSSLAQAKPGDLLFFENGIQPGVDHVAIYLGNNKMIAAPKAGDVVKIQNVYKTPAAIRRVLPDQASGPAAASAARSVSSTGGANPSGSIPWVKYHDQIVASATKHGVPAKFLGAVLTVENSTGNPTLKSAAGAVGVAQFMPQTAARFGIDPTDPRQSIDAAGKYLSMLYREFGSLDLAAAGYNAGEGNVRKYGGVPPFDETQNYVQKVNKAMAVLR